MSSDTELTEREDAQAANGSNPPEPISVKVRRLFSPPLAAPDSPTTIGTSRTADRFDPEELPDPICASCGWPIMETDQECPARDGGVCAP